jgi:hypothetical protein
MVTKVDSGLISHDGGTLKEVLDTIKPLGNYSNLRAYAGAAIQVRITDPGISGFFYYDSTDTTSVDNGGTIIVSGNGKRWKRIYNDSVSVLWFMSTSQINDVKSGGATLDVTAAIQAAIDTHDVVSLPQGSYSITSLKINKNNFSFIGDGVNRSILIATPGTHAAIEIATTMTTSGTLLRDFKIQGNPTALGGISLGSATCAATAIVIQQVNIWDFSQSNTVSGFGIQLNSVQNCDISNCFIYRNRHGLQRPNLGYLTSTHISGKYTYLGEGYIGIYINGQCDDLYIEDAVIEGNNNSGILITANAVSLNRGSRIAINKCYFELNNASGGGTIYIAGGAGAYQDHTVTINQCQFAAYSALPNISLDRVFATISNNALTPNQVVTTATCKIRFDRNIFPNAGDYLTQYRALLGNIIATDFVNPGTSSDLDQVNLVDAITFPLTQRAVNDPHTLDDYREGTWTPLLSSDGIAPTVSSYSDQIGTYTKIGNLVFIRCQIRATISNIGIGTPRVTGLPYSSEGLEPPVMSLSSLLTTVSGPNYIVTGPAVVFSGATYTTSNNGYLVFTATYRAP